MAGVTDKQWVRWRMETAPAPRTGHSLTRTCFQDDARVFIYGGQDVNKRITFNDLWVLDAEYRADYNRDLQWDQLYPGGEIPTSRWNHTTTYVDNYLFVFGGEDAELNTLHDLKVYSVESNQWLYTRPFLPYPPARQLHSCCNVDNHLVVVGGRGATRHTDLTDVWIFDTEIMRWLQLPFKPSAAPSPFKDDNGNPRSLEGHSATVVDRNKVMIHGGHFDGVYNADTWLLDLVSHQWTKLHLPPSDLPNPPLPGLRARHATAQELEHPEYSYTFGGRGESKKLDDLWVLRTEIERNELGEEIQPVL